MKLPTKYSSLTWQEKREVREAYIKKQNNLCYFCKESLSSEPKDKRKVNWKLFPPNFLRYPIHLHHNHNTDMTLGAVHAYCNAILWQYYRE